MIFSCINTVLIFVWMVVPGYIGTKKGIVKSEHMDGLSMLLVNFLWPAMVMQVMHTSRFSAEMVQTAWYTAVVCFVGYMLAGVIAYIYWTLRRVKPSLRGILTFAVAIGNTGFIGIPFVSVALGQKAVFVGSIAELVNDLIIFTLGVVILRSGQKTTVEENPFKEMLSPGFIGVLIGLVLFAFQIPLPSSIEKALEFFSNATTATAMFLTGAQLGEVPLGKLLREKRVYEVIVWRLLIIPVCMAAVLYLIPGRGDVDQAIVLMFAMPAATCLPVFARQYKLDYQTATTCVMLSTLLLMLTLPVWLAVTNILFR